ncbi:MAG: uracil-DNA glycosylase [Parachlamydiaceae bacterium]|nr:uracil-DNA glycosylase [Parachlamydiaceae bacterium]
MTFNIDPLWNKILAEELAQPYMQQLAAFVAAERKVSDLPIYPEQSSLFKALQKTSYADARVVILGQDPYHGPGQATGLCFSVPEGIPFPPSLRNIFKELQDDLGIQIPKHGCLDAWAEQGVLLFNNTLTVRHGLPHSHKGKGWERFTDAVLLKLAQREEPPIFVLWGNAAQKKAHFLKNYPQVICLEAMHPSPLSAHRGFFGCRHFSKINALLVQQGKTPINWQL